MGGRLLPLVLAVGSVASAGVAAVPSLVDDPPAPNPVTVATPVFSVRRAPELTTRVVADARLRTELHRILAGPDLGGARTCLTVHGPEGHLVLDHAGTETLIPASTVKLITTSTALARMGPDATFRTEVRGTPGADGRVEELWLVGGGDALLATADFAQTAGWQFAPRDFTPVEELADRVVNAGVRSVGRLLGDESRYDGQRYVPTWKDTYATAPEIGPQSALVVNSGLVGRRPGAVPAAAPAIHAAQVLAGLLEERGIAVGGVGQAVAPEGAPAVAGIDSLPLREVVRVILHHSDNLAAELLVKELGVRYGEGGTTAAGLAVVASELTRLGEEGGAFTAVDGSGLDRGNRLSCRLIESVLAEGGREGPMAELLPEAGSTGTLVRRFEGTEAAGDVRAKTGSLSGVTALAGWTTGHDGRALRFALLANDVPSGGASSALQDAVAVALARYPQAPAPDEVAPEPPVRDPAGRGPASGDDVASEGP